MLKRYHHIVGGTFRIVDACVIAGAWLISFWIRFEAPLVQSIWPVTKGLPPFSQYAALAPVVLFVWMTTFSVMRVYQSRRMLRRTHEVINILRAHFVAMLFFIALTYLFSEYVYSRIVMMSFGLLGAVLLVVFRLGLRNALRAMRRKGYNLKHVLAIGEGPSLEAIIWRLERFPELGLRVVGVLTHEDSKVQHVQKRPVLGHYQATGEALREYGVDEVLISLPRSQYSDMDSILHQIKDETIDVRVIPDIHEFITLGCEVEDFDGYPVVNINESPLDGWGAVAKRLMDLVLTTVGVVALSPLLLIVAALVKLTSRGPILYSQERMGLDGRTFKIYKFRSMRVDAEKETGAVWAQAGDDRRTPIGAFLRSTNLDELPQLWNVLWGDMSLVGPRPERPVFVDKFRTEIPHYMLRHKVKAGITGWAQVHGWRGNTSLEKRIEFDLYYIRNWSFFLDFKILWLTLRKGFLDKNAY